MQKWMLPHSSVYSLPLNNRILQLDIKSDFMTEEL
jgi:hypothetical protein